MNFTYSAVDRLLHRLALGNLALQKSLADMESHLHAARLREITAERPVFVTSLPRGGTTALLTALHAAGGFAAQTYRDMPFVLCPLLWQSLSRGFQRKAEPHERAHGDGMPVGYDSPEGFEEVLWKAFWPGKYAADHILPWSRSDRDGEFEEAFALHMRKVVAARADGSSQALRYLSKNNANIARLPLLAALFPDCTILIPFRNPADHAGSLAHQHENFLARHAEDRFARSYMEWLGHYEFGEALRPIAFLGEPPGRPALADFWLDYWDRAFRHMLRDLPDQAVLIDLDRLCADPQRGLARIGDALGLPSGMLPGEAGLFRASRPYPAPVPSPAWARAQHTHTALRERERAVRAI